MDPVNEDTCEAYIQQLYAANAKILLQEVMINECKEQIEFINKEKDSVDQYLKEENEKFNSCKLQNSILKSDLEEAKIQIIKYEEAESYAKDNAKKLQSLEKTKKESEFDDRSELLLELDLCKEELQLFKSNADQNMLNANKVESIIYKLNANIKELETELEEVKSLLSRKTNEVNETLSLLESTKEEKMLLEIELQSLRTVPADEKLRGNSLFAEVDDKRRELVNKLKLICEKYMKLKKLYQYKNVELNKLSREITLWKQKFNAQKHSNGTSKADKELISAQERTIRELQSMVKTLQSKCDAAYAPTANPTSINFTQALINNNNAEVEKLRKSIYLNAMNKWMMEMEMHKLKVSVARVENEVAELKIKNLSLAEHEIENTELKRQLSDIKQQESMASEGGSAVLSDRTNTDKKSVDPDLKRVHFKD